MSMTKLDHSRERTIVHDIGTYQIWVRGSAEETTLNRGSPLRITVVQRDAGATRLTLCADQSGLIGLLRYLHGQGYVLLSVQREVREGGATVQHLSRKETRG